MLKKGEGNPRRLLFILIIGVLVILAVSGVIYKIFSSANEAYAKIACKSSVQQSALLHVRGIDISEDIKCPTQYITVGEKEEEKIKKKLADELYNCWDNFGQGELELFKEDGAYCHVCSVIEFDEKNRKVVGFGSYLLETDIPRKGMTYAEFLAGYETRGASILGRISAEQKAQLDSEVVDTNKKYATIFLYAKGKDLTRQRINHVTGATPEGVVGGLGFAVGMGVFGGALLIMSGPVGWAVAATGIIFAGASEVGTYLLSDDNHPEWISMIFLREYSGDELRALGCEKLPVKQNT